mmetsp:Transcript_51410/g.149322  ORF Transcript_51410/g.149322 Transcript_51410/m.149322 type:complete len:116 (+) Transcript_51410:183-530(+)
MSMTAASLLLLIRPPPFPRKVAPCHQLRLDGAVIVVVRQTVYFGMLFTSLGPTKHCTWHCGAMLRLYRRTMQSRRWVALLTSMPGKVLQQCQGTRPHPVRLTEPLVALVHLKDGH